MKKFLILTALLWAAIPAWNQTIIDTFSVVTPSGHILYFSSLSFSGEVYTLVIRPDGGYGSGLAGGLIIPDSVVYNGNTYTVNSIGYGAFRECSGLTSITIPNSVTSIDLYAFSGCSGLTSVTIPNSVTYIGDGAFEGCSGLTSVTIPNSVINIGYSAFSGCSGLTSVTIPNSVTRIGNNAFAHCSGLTSIVVSSGNTVYDSRNNCNAIIHTETNTLIAGCQNTIIPNSVTSIDLYAFYGCSGLTSITIPNSVTSIGYSAFWGCSGLTSITVSSGNTVFDSRNNCNAIIHTETNTLIAGCQNTIIPNSVTYIGFSAFYGCSGLTSITIPNSVTSIGEWAFAACSGLTSITVSSGNTVYDSRNNCNAIIHTATNTLIAGCQNTIIPNSVTYIGFYAFAGCSGLTSITIPNSVTGIGDQAFAGCSGLTSITIPNSVTYIGFSVFYGCSGLTSITIPNSVTSIGNNAFYNCSGLTSVTIPNSVTSIGNYAFYNCSGLTTVNFNADSCIYMGSQNEPVFQGCTNLETLNIGNNVKIIPDSAFFGFYHLTSVNIPNSATLTSIGVSAFEGCTGLTSVTIPQNVTNIGDNAFANCSNLSEIHSLNRVAPILGSSAFEGVPSTIPVHIPCGSSASYYSRWSYFSNFIEEAGFTFTATSDNEQQGTVQILTMPTCTSPQAVLYATANSGYRFDHWSDGSTSNPYSLTVTDDLDLIGYFVADSTEGISDIDADGLRIYSENGRIAIEGAEGEAVAIYDMMGRDVCNDNLPAGVYMVRVGNHPARKVAVIR